MTTSRSWLQDRGCDTGLLVLRMGAGISLLLLFGLPKLQAGLAFFHTGQWVFVDFNRKLGLPAPVWVAWFQSLNESLGALFLACGFLTRYAAAALALGFAVAAYWSLKAEEPAWMMAGYFCVMFTSLLLTGPGRFSIDSLLHSRAVARLSQEVR